MENYERMSEPVTHGDPDIPAQPFRTKLAPTATASQDFILLIRIPPFVA
jgi:hypothetical protein